jgi:hypothetical protein
MAVPTTKAYSSRTVVKTYTKVLDVSSSFSGAAAGTGEVSAGLLVEFEDTSAVGLGSTTWVQARWITSATVHQGYGWMAPASGSAVTTGSKVNAGATTNTGQGALGVAMAANETYTMHYAGGEVSKMYVYNIFGADMRLLITYGVENTPLADADDDVAIGH